MRVCKLAAPLALLFGTFTSASAQSAAPLGTFTSQSDVGAVSAAGTASFDEKTGAYSISSAGGDLWAAEDDFHFVWKKASGDLAITAEIKVAQNDAAAHPLRKAFLMVRESLDTDAKYVDAAVHGNGETAIQYRRAKGDSTQDIAFNIGAPQRIRLEKRGDTFTLFLSMHGEPLHQSGAAIKVPFTGEFYVGLGVCAHDAHKAQSATFSNVNVAALQPRATTAKKVWYSSLLTVNIDPNARGAWLARTARERMEAPNWTRDGKTLVYNANGRMFTVPATGGPASLLDIGDASDCTGSHGLSPDGKLLAITCVTPGHPERRVYAIPSTGGGTPKMITQGANSYFHSWSPDGQTILFTRWKEGSINIYAVPATGGDEKQITTGKATSDDPDYSPDGQWIYFNSDRGGSMQIWRMKADGSDPEQITSDDRPNWTPHPSPDGKSVLILSYQNGVKDHPANKDVTMRIVDVSTKKIRDIVEIVGGGGTDNVANWAPDGTHFAIVSYQELPDPENGSTE